MGDDGEGKCALTETITEFTPGVNTRPGVSTRRANPLPMWRNGPPHVRHFASASASIRRARSARVPLIKSFARLAYDLRTRVIRVPLAFADSRRQFLVFLISFLYHK